VTKITDFETFEIRRWRKCSAKNKQFTSYWDLVGEPGGPPVPDKYLAEPEGKPQNAPTSGYSSIIRGVRNLFVRRPNHIQPTNPEREN